MKIFYTASYYGKSKYQKYYDMVLRSIELCDVKIISPEKGNYKSLLTPRENTLIKDPKKLHYNAIKKGILHSDAAIIEISNEDFQLGHEATLAIQNKKHVLCLSVHEDFSSKIVNRYFHGAKYNQFNIEEIVENFITTVKVNLLSERFNFFLSKVQLDFLEQEAKEKNVSKSEYLRMLIESQRKQYK